MLAHTPTSSETNGNLSDAIQFLHKCSFGQHKPEVWKRKE